MVSSKIDFSCMHTGRALYPWLGVSMKKCFFYIFLEVRCERRRCLFWPRSFFLPSSRLRLHNTQTHRPRTGGEQLTRERNSRTAATIPAPIIKKNNKLKTSTHNASPLKGKSPPRVSRYKFCKATYFPFTSSAHDAAEEKPTPRNAHIYRNPFVVDSYVYICIFTASRWEVRRRGGRTWAAPSSS